MQPKCWPMPDIGSYLSQFGLPAGAIALAVGLVRGAKALETDANPQALRYVSDLITKGDLRNIGKAGASLVPFVFDKVFGPKPFSFRFISRSILATTLFWLILLLVKRPDWHEIASAILGSLAYVILILLWYVLDWLSLVKAKWLINLISQKYSLISSFIFVTGDLFFSYVLAFLFRELHILLSVFFVFPIEDVNTMRVLSFKVIMSMFSNENLENYLSLHAISRYIDLGTGEVTLFDVITPSTMLTSIWTFLLFISCLIAQLLVPIDHLRRFTTWWFKNVEHHPLTAIAKVAATLIVVGAMAIKVVRWVY